MRKADIHLRGRKIRSVAEKAGADLVGFADLTKLKGFFEVSDELIQDHPFGICIAVGLDKMGQYDNAMEDDRAFPLLERIAKEVEKEIKREGYSSRIVKPDKRVAHNSPLYWRGEVSHKAAAKIAGLGWTGRSTLLVTPELGPRVCLATILTDMPLPPGKPMTSKCGRCMLCVESCPLGALKGVAFDDHPADVALAIEVAKCGKFVNRTWADGRMCYECMLACPQGKKRAAKRERSKSHL